MVHSYIHIYFSSHTVHKIVSANFFSAVRSLYHNVTSYLTTIPSIYSTSTSAETVLQINEEEPTRCCLVFYYTYDRVNMIQAPLCPSSGAHDYTVEYHMGRLVLRLLIVGG
jgi:hypothetical protein